MTWIDDAHQDLRYALRSLARQPGFALVAILTLALGIGANTAIFSVVHAVLLSPPSYASDSAPVVRLMMNMPAAASPTGRPLRTFVTLSAREAADLRHRTSALSQVAIAGQELASLRGFEGAARLLGGRVSSSVFSMLGARPIAGRAIEPRDEAAGADPVMLLGFSAWQRFFGGDPHVVGRQVTLDSVLGPRRERRVTIVGVMPASFAFPTSQAQFWTPVVPPPATATTPAANLARAPLIAQLADGYSTQAAAAALGPVVREIRQDKPGVTYDVVRDQDEQVAPVRPALVVLAVAVGVVLLIACVNVANLLLARMNARQREIAVRASLGAGQGRLVRQTLSESVVLASMGGVAGVVLALGMLALLRILLGAMLPRIDIVNATAFPRFDEIGIDVTVLAYTAALSLGAGLLFGLAPAIRYSRADPMAIFRTAGGAAAGNTATKRGLSGALVVAQVASAVVLLVAGGLVVRSFANLVAVSPGYDAEHVLTFQVSLGGAPEARTKAFAEELVARLRAAPGVIAAAYANQLPTIGLRDTAGGLFQTPDPNRPPAPNGADARLVSRDYFAAIGMRVLSGRGFGPEDRAGQPRALVVNQLLARRDFAGENPIGRQVFIGRDVEPWQIVGVVNDVRQFGLDREPEPQFFVDLRQWSQERLVFPAGAYYVVRTRRDSLTLLPDVRAMVRSLDAQSALFNAEPMNRLVTSTVAAPRLYAVLLAVFAAVGLILAATGVYGLVSYGVTARTREIGVRVTLGAQRAAVLGLVVRQSLALTALGIMLGLVGAALASRYLASMLFGLTPLDPVTFIGVGAILTAAATLASYLPARRALQVDPLVALRHE